MPPAFPHGERKGLLDVDVLARVAGHDGLDGMPVVGRGDDHRVDVLLVEDAAEILVPLDRPSEIGQPGGDPVGQLLEMGMDPIELPVQVRLIDVAECDDLGILVPDERIQDLHAPVADADDSRCGPGRWRRSPGPRDRRRGSRPPSRPRGPPW